MVHKRTAFSWLLIFAIMAMLLTGCGNQTTETAQTAESTSPASAETMPPASESSELAPEDEAAAGNPADTAADEELDSFSYEHDPQLNPAAMADIVADETAVYDPEVVETGRQERLAYHDSFAEMYDLLGKMRAADKDIEEIARAVSALRNELRMAAYDGDPEGLETMKARNLEKYGHEEGPLPDELFEQYGSWEMVLEKTFSVSSGMDACLGLYDDYYDLYVLAGQVAPDDGF